MPKYSFSSPFAAFSGGLEQALMQREIQKRQAMLDAITQRQAEAQIANSEAGRALQRDQFNYGRAKDLTEMAGGAEAATPDVAELLQQQGFGGRLETRNTGGTPGVGVLAEAPEGAELATEKQFVKPGASFEMARAAEEARASEAAAARGARAEQAAADRAFRAEEGEKSRTATAERAKSDRELKELIARMSASTDASSRAIADQLKTVQLQTAQDKLETTQTERARTADNAKQSTQTALAAVNRLLDPNDVGGNIGAATGAYEMRGFTQGAQDFNGIRDQLVSALALPNLGALKGPMSDKDILFVKQLATRLGNTKLSDTETQRALIEAQQFLQGKLGGAPAEASGGGVPGVGPAVGAQRTINGVPAVWDGRGWKRR